MNKPEIINFAPDIDSIRINFGEYGVLISRQETGEVNVIIEEHATKTNFAEMVLGENEDD